MKPMFVTVLVFVALGLLARCQPTMPASSLAADTPSPIPIVQPEPTSAAPPTPHPREVGQLNTSLQPTPVVSPTLADNWQAYTTGFGLTFACPADWQVGQPGQYDLGRGSGIRLRAPAASYPGGNVFHLGVTLYAIGANQSLRDWAQQVFLADQHHMLPPRAILAMVDVPPAEPGGQALLTTELAGPGSGYHRHHIYLTRGQWVFDLGGDTTQAEGPASQQILREIAGTIRFAAPAPTRDAAFGQPDPTTIAALTTTPRAQHPAGTPIPSAKLTATARPTPQPGLALYQGRSLSGGQTATATASPTYSFQLAYDPAAWNLEGDDQRAVLSSRASPSCKLTVQDFGEWGGPVVADSMSLAGLEWSTTYWIDSGVVFYGPRLGRTGPWFTAAAGFQAPTATVEACRRAVEEVLSTFQMQ